MKGPLLLLMTLSGLTAAAAVVPWDSDRLYQLSSTNRPAEPLDTVATPVRALRDLRLPALTNAASSTFGAGVRLHGMTRSDFSNELADAATRAGERRFSDMLKDVDNLTREGRAEEAIALLKQQLNQPLSPEQRARVNSRIASYYFRTQRYADALPFMREAVRLNPQDFGTQCNLAAVLLSMGEIKEAGFLLKTIEIARITETRLLFSIFFNRACVASLESDAKTSIDQLRKAAQTDPQSTLASLGDPQLDNIRPGLDFFDLKAGLEMMLNPSE